MNAWGAAALALSLSLPYYLIPWWRRGIKTMAEIMGTGGIFPGDATKAVGPVYLSFLSFGLTFLQQAAWPDPPVVVNVLSSAATAVGSVAILIAAWHFLVPSRKPNAKAGTETTPTSGEDD